MQDHPPAVTSSNYQATISQRGFVVIDCSAVWCGPCKVFAPVFADAARRRKDLAWATLDTDAEPAIAAQLDIRAAPTIVVFRDGAVVYKHVGALNATKFAELIERVAGATKA